MKKLYLPIIFIPLIAVLSCSRKVPEMAKSIPEQAVAVATFHPKKIFEKGQISSMQNLTGKIENEILAGIIKDPLMSGVKLNDYLLLFAYFMEDDMFIGTTASIDDQEKFTNMIRGLIEKDENLEITSREEFSMVTLNQEPKGLAWNDDQFILLTSPGANFSGEEWQNELIRLFRLEKENAVTSIVDFIDFSGKLSDMSFWVTGDKIEELLEKSGAMDNANVQLPVSLKNNYAQLFLEFDKGAMYAHSELHLNDDIKKAASSMMMMKGELNSDMMKLTPGHNLLMATAFSMEIENLVKLSKGINPPELDSVSNKIEGITGVPGKEIVEALNGDFVLAINGSSKESLIPVDILLGIGLNDNSLQEKMMGSVQGMADVKKDGDFFMIKTNGIELYSGIVNGVWVITNTAGYKDALDDKGLEKDLTDSKFNDFAGGSLGMYLNLDLSTYPKSLQTMIPQNENETPLALITDAFQYMGMEATNKKNEMVLKTSADDENSLYTMFSIIDKIAEKN